MLTEERQSIILEMVNKQRSVRLSELSVLLDTSESTIRRDLNSLAEKGAVIKVHGGAIAVNDSFLPVEHNVEEKSKLFTEEKKAIARYAASLVEDGDLIFIDVGTTTEKMIDYLPDKSAAFVTNGFVNAKKLAQRGLKVFVPAGEIKLTTEAIIGAECVLTLQNYNFTKCFMGVNGISVANGLSTPDKNEASVKTAVIHNSQMAYVLADHSKFDRVTSITFASLNRVRIITDKLDDKRYLAEAFIKEVL